MNQLGLIMRWILLLFLALGSPAAAQTAQKNVDTELWYNPRIPAAGGDWHELFEKDAPWPIASRKISVLTLGQNWIRGATDAQILLQTDWARHHHIKLNMESQVVAKYPTDKCGWIEGYSYPHGEVMQAVTTLQRLHVQLDWIQMDEPLALGHYTTGMGGCRLSLADVTARTVQVMQDVLAVYPNIDIAQTEPIPFLTDQADWADTLTKFRRDLEQQLHVKINVMHVDMNWNDPTWPKAIQSLDTYLRQHNMRWGVYLNATSSTVGDLAWNAQAVTNFEALEGTYGMRPAQGVFASWDLNPVHNLPELDPGALTWLVNRYDRPRSSLQVQFQGDNAVGRLTTERGLAIAGARINASVSGSDLTQPLPILAVGGTVPATATQASFMVRLNAECGGCAGVDDVLLGTNHYQETAGGSRTARYLEPTATTVYQGGVTMTGMVVGGALVSRMKSYAGRPIYWGSPPFPVTPGAKFTYSAPTGTVGSNGWHGIIGVIFLGPNGEVSRTTVTPAPGSTTLRPEVTGVDGSFRIPHLPKYSVGGTPVSITFDGGGVYRQVTWRPPPPISSSP